MSSDQKNTDSVIDLDAFRRRRGLPVSRQKVIDDLNDALREDVAHNHVPRKVVIDVSNEPSPRGMVLWYINGEEFELSVENARNLANKFLTAATRVQRILRVRANQCVRCGKDRYGCACAAKYPKTHLMVGEHPACNSKRRYRRTTPVLSEVTCARCRKMFTP